MATPKRIQRKRNKGWRMPEGAVYVGRPTKWGNPFSVGDGSSTFHCDSVKETVEAYRSILTGPTPVFLARDLPELRGRDLACWCPLDQPCHADVLLELANA